MSAQEIREIEINEDFINLAHDYITEQSVYFGDDYVFAKPTSSDVGDLIHKCFGFVKLETKGDNEKEHSGKITSPIITSVINLNGKTSVKYNIDCVKFVKKLCELLLEAKEINLSDEFYKEMLEACQNRAE